MKACPRRNLVPGYDDKEEETMSKTSIPNAHIIPDGDLDGIIMRLHAAHITLDYLYDILSDAHGTPAEKASVMLYGVVCAVEQAAKDLNELQSVSRAVDTGKDVTA